MTHMATLPPPPVTPPAEAPDDGPRFLDCRGEWHSLADERREPVPAGASLEASC